MAKKTLTIMDKLGFPLDKMTIFFKEPNEILHNFRKNCVFTS